MSSSATLNPSARSGGAPGSSASGKFLTFALGSEEYGLQILKVREIVGYMDVTTVPRTAPFVKGVINLRGQVIPVIDLRVKFGMPAAERTEETCIIVADIRSGGRKVNVGVIVDRVSEVLDIPADQIEEPPSLGSSLGTEYLLGLGKVGKSVKILLDIDRIVGSADVLNLPRVNEESNKQG